MNTYKITETIVYYVEGNNEEEAWENFNSPEFDRADVTSLDRFIQEVKL